MRRFQMILFLLGLLTNELVYAGPCPTQAFLQQMFERTDGSIVKAEVIFGKKAVTGQVGYFKVSDDYGIHVLRDKNLDFHFFDNASGEFKIRRLSDQEYRTSIQNTTSALKINPKAATKEVCKVYRALSANPDFQKIKPAVERYVVENRRKTFYTSGCLSSAVGGLGLMYAWRSSVDYRVEQALKKDGKVPEWLNHASNFYLTLPVMAGIQYCTGLLSAEGASGISTVMHRGLIASSFASGIVLNSIDEIHKDKKTGEAKFDVNDLKSGAAAIASYALWVAISERRLKFNFAQACAK